MAAPAALVTCSTAPAGEGAVVRTLKNSLSAVAAVTRQHSESRSEVRVNVVEGPPTVVDVGFAHLAVLDTSRRTRWYVSPWLVVITSAV